MLYEYTLYWKPEKAEKFLKGFSGYLHADEYQGYHNLPREITEVGCMTHLRLKFIEVVDDIPEADRKTSAAQKGLSCIEKLYDIADSIREKSAEERYIMRQEQSKPVFFKAMLAWAKTMKAPPKSHFRKAVYYLSE